MGPAASVVADQLNAFNDELVEATTERDKIAGEAARLAIPQWQAIRRVSPETVIARTVDDALLAGRAAYRRWIEGGWDKIPVEDMDLCYGEDAALDASEQAAKDHFQLPPHDSVPGWHAWQAALSALGVTMTVNQVSAEVPRWVAQMRLPGGAVEGTLTC